MRLLGKLAGKLTYANVVATLALFIALGGASYAAVQLPKNSVGAKQIKKGSITTDKLSKKTRAKLSGSAGPAGPAGLKGADGVKGATGPSDVYYDAYGPTPIGANSSVTLLNTGNLPVGDYLVEVEVNSSNTGVTSVGIDCNVRNVNGASGVLLETKSIVVAPGAGATGQVHFSLPLSIDTLPAVSVDCSAAPTSGNAMLQGTVTATAVSTLHQ